jgi:rubrerythrin
MDKLKNIERESLLEAAKKIRAYKLMQAKGYERLARKAKDERTKQLLVEISTNEVKDTEYWSQKIRDLGVEGDKSISASLMNRKVALMMSFLGTRGFFEWAIIAEDESIEDLAIQAGNISDVPASETWTRIASDERLHVERMKKEVLGMEAWEMGGGGGVRDVIRGCISHSHPALRLYGCKTGSYNRGDRQCSYPVRCWS